MLRDLIIDKLREHEVLIPNLALDKVERILHVGVRLPKLLYLLYLVEERFKQLDSVANECAIHFLACLEKMAQLLQTRQPQRLDLC